MVLLYVEFQSTPSSRRVTKKDREKEKRKIFQSTPSSRRVTQRVPSTQPVGQISIDTLLAESDLFTSFVFYRGNTISIHTLLAESDSISSIVNTQSGIFQSTPSSRRVTRWVLFGINRHIDFNPHPPRGE